jgi:hypothetical protein
MNVIESQALPYFGRIHQNLVFGHQLPVPHLVLYYAKKPKEWFLSSDPTERVINPRWPWKERLFQSGNSISQIFASIINLKNSRSSPGGYRR